MSFEQVFEEIRNNTQRMSDTLDMVKKDTGRTLQITEQSASVQKEAAGVIETENARNEADLVPEAPATGPGSGGQMFKIVNILGDIREILEEKDFGGGGDKGGGGFDPKSITKFLPQGKQTGGFIYPSPVQAFQQGGGVFKVPGNSTGDNHDMLLPQGSFVLNRNASKLLQAQSGGMIPPPMSPMGFQEGNMVPVKTESEEMVFGPGSFSNLVPILNKLAPRFQTGGVVPASHPDTGKGFQPSGSTDYKGRPVVLSKSAAEAFAKAILESGGQVKGNDVASSQRSQAKNSSLPGAHPNSTHLYGEGLDASGTTAQYLKSNPQFGFNFGYSHGPGSAHFNFKGGTGNQAAPDQYNTAAVTQSDENPPSPQSSNDPLTSAGFIDKISSAQGIGGSPFLSMGNPNDLSAEFFSGYTSDVLSSNNPSPMGGLNGMFGGVMNAVTNIMTGGNFFDIAKLVTGGLGGLLGGGNPNVGAPLQPGQQPGQQSSVGSKGIFDLIGSGEGDYNSMNRGTAGDSPGGSINHIGKNLTDMTVGQVMDMQSRGQLFAAGKYQIIPSTMKEFVSGAGISRDDKFDTATQEKFTNYVTTQKRPAVGKYLSGNGSIEEAGQALAREFASVGLQYPEAGRPRGSSRYSDTGGNAASISPEQIIETLKKDKASMGKQTGGKITTPFGGGKGLQPVKVESGELIFSPGSYSAEIPTLNDNVPRFQSGGMVGGNVPKFQLGGNISASSPSVDNANVQNFVSSRFAASNQTHNAMSQEQQQPIVIPVPMGGNQEASNVSDGFGGGSPIPSLTSAPSNHIVSSLMMSSYSLMQRIG